MLYQATVLSASKCRPAWLKSDKNHLWIVLWSGFRWMDRVSIIGPSPPPPPKTNMTMEHPNHLKMYFLLNMGIFQPVMLVFRGVLYHVSPSILLGFPILFQCLDVLPMSSFRDSMWTPKAATFSNYMHLGKLLWFLNLVGKTWIIVLRGFCGEDSLTFHHQVGVTTTNRREKVRSQQIGPDIIPSVESKPMKIHIGFYRFEKPIFFWTDVSFTEV